MATVSNNRELQVLWYLKNQGGKVMLNPNEGRRSLINEMANAIGVTPQHTRYVLRQLEEKSLVLRTYAKGKADYFSPDMGRNPCIRIELVDPNMVLPPVATIPLAVVVAQENEQLYEALEHEPHSDDIILALLEENQGLHKQLDKLRDIIDDQAKQLIRKAEEERSRRIPAQHLTSRVRDALPPEVWDRLTHGR